MTITVKLFIADIITLEKDVNKFLDTLNITNKYPPQMSFMQSPHSDKIYVYIVYDKKGLKKK